jgi:hypothetical protein
VAHFAGKTTTPTSNAVPHRDQIGQRGLSTAVGTTFFSLLQSLPYEYPDEWLRVCLFSAILPGAVKIAIISYS